MEKVIIQEERKNCPGMYYYPEKNMLEVKGRSIPENPEAIFKRLDEWITGHFEISDALNVDFMLEYINSGSSKFLYEILKKFSNYINKGNSVSIRWLYEEDDETMLELGEHFRDTAGIPLTIEMI